ncbi:MAG: hypothetical protein O3C67_06690 [Cyanobacteria bacterium]|nr:hypothetical protein [Cyanobacteriota bacterium]
MQKCLSLAIAPAIGLGLITQVALANTPTQGSDHLLPLEARNLGTEIDANRFETVSAQINQALGHKPNQENVLDTADMPWLEGFIGENGEAKLPLGLTVFSTLGDPSVGFGGSF